MHIQRCDPVYDINNVLILDPLACLMSNSQGHTLRIIVTGADFVLINSQTFQNHKVFYLIRCLIISFAWESYDCSTDWITWPKKEP